MDFLGSKTFLLGAIESEVRNHLPSGGSIADVFSGSGAVSAHLRSVGFRVHANDLLPLCVNAAQAVLLTPSSPKFGGLRDTIEIGGDPYADVLRYLMALRPVEGWVTRTYTPASISNYGFERMYLTESNGRKIDAIRQKILSWTPIITTAERAVLLASLVNGIVDVSNTAGTYGAYLKKWKPSSRRAMALEKIKIPYNDTKSHTVTAEDAECVVSETDCDVVYADPPYTKRQYAAYYHLLNSVVGEKDPEVTGKTGLPNWQNWRSDWCYARRAPLALERLVAKYSNKCLILSYSSDGHIKHEEILRIMNNYGTVRHTEVARRRYKSSSLTQQSDSVIERLYVVEK